MPRLSRMALKKLRGSNMDTEVVIKDIYYNKDSRKIEFPEKNKHENDIETNGRETLHSIVSQWAA